MQSLSHLYSHRLETFTKNSQKCKNQVVKHSPSGSLPGGEGGETSTLHPPGPPGASDMWWRHHLVWHNPHSLTPLLPSCPHCSPHPWTPWGLGHMVGTLKHLIQHTSCPLANSLLLLPLAPLLPIPPGSPGGKGEKGLTISHPLDSLGPQTSGGDPKTPCTACPSPPLPPGSLGPQAALEVRGKGMLYYVLGSPPPPSQKSLMTKDSG